MNRLNLTNTLKDEFSNKVYRNLATELASPKWKKKKNHYRGGSNMGSSPFSTTD